MQHRGVTAAGDEHDERIEGPSVAGGRPELPLDIRERHRDEFAPLGSALPLGVLSAVGMGTVVYANEAATVMLGRPEPELLGRGWEETIHPHDRPELVAAIAVVLDTGARQRVTLRRADDEDLWLELNLVPLGSRHHPTGWLATFDDVSDRVRAERRLAHQATHDSLTHLPNRALLADRLRHAGHRLARAAPGAAVAVLFLDLDDFKDINDRHGHAAGDAVLVEAARRLVGVVRSSDTVARFGGDEFVAVCELASADEVPALVERVRGELARPLAVPGDELTLRASIGVAVATDPHTDIGALLDTADREMYRHKTARKVPPPSWT